LISLVNKTIYASTTNSSGSFALTNPSTIGNWLVLALFQSNIVIPGTIVTDQGESFTQESLVSGFNSFGWNMYLYLLRTTKVATDINFSGFNVSIYPTFAVYEISGNDLTLGAIPSSRTSGATTSFAGPTLSGGPGGASTFYVTTSCSGGNNGTGSTTAVSSPWTLDKMQDTHLVVNQGTATYVGTGSQTATFTLSSSDAEGCCALFVYEGITTISTTTSLVSAPDPSDLSQSVTFTATVNGPGGTGSPTGTVTFNIDGSNVATVNVTAVSTGVSQAQYSTSSLSLGIHPVLASYSGDSQYLASVSSPIDQIVVQQCPFPFGTALQELANRLYDSTMQFWSSTELVYYIQEAFRTWNALTSYWRGDFTFPTQQGVVFYDITNATIAPNTLRPYTITDQYLYNIIEYHLLEPAVGAGPWTGSLQFDIDDILNAVQRRDNEILGVTGCAVTHFTTVATPDRIYMPNTTLEIRRVAYVPGSGEGSTVPMFQDDTWGIGAYQPSYTTQPPGTPSTYRISTEPVLSFDADVPPLPGQYDLVTIQAGPQLVTTQASTFTIPDDWTWVLKWGALADLLGKESNAKDLLRAKYCEGRYKQGLQLLSAASAVLAVRANNAPLQIDALKSADLFNPAWQGAAQGPPTEAMTAGLNLIAVPPPDAGPYSLTATVVENAPVPVLVGDCLQVTQDVFDVILDYAQHLAAFKMGGEEFLATQPLLQRFMQLAALYSSKLAEQGEFTKILYAISQDEANMNPRYTPDSDPASGGDE
jgi:hypothetical protein